MADTYTQHETALARVAAFVEALPGVSPHFAGKYRMLADPVRGRQRLRLLEYELEIARFQPRGEVVLDAGAGTGLYSVLFALLGAARVEAIDFFPQNVEFLERLAKEFALPIAPRLADIAHTGLADGSVGLVYCTEAISHFHCWQAFLDEAARLIRPGGRVLIADGNNGANPAILRAIHRFWDASERGPFSSADFPAGRNLPYLFRRWMIIRRTFPDATDEQVFQLGLRTSDRGGAELIEACRSYFATGELPGGGYRYGQSQHRPEDGQRNEEPLDPRAIAGYLRGRGLRAVARAHFGFNRSPLLPAMNRAASLLGTLPLRFSERYLVIATK